MTTPQRVSELARVYGLTVRSEVPLHLRRPVPAGTQVDLEIAIGAPVAQTEAMPPGRVLLDLRGRRRYYAATAVDEGFRLRFFGSCDVDLDPMLTRATVHPMPGADPDLLSVLVSGTLLAFVLTMRGKPSCTRARCRSATRPWRSSVPRAWASRRWRRCSARTAPGSSPTTCSVSTRRAPHRRAPWVRPSYPPQGRRPPVRAVRPQAGECPAAPHDRRCPPGARRSAGDHGGSSARGAVCSPARPLAPALHHRDHAAVVNRGDGAPLPVPTPARLAGRLGPPGAVPPARGRRRPGCRSTPPRCPGAPRSRTTSPLSVLRATGLTADDGAGVGAAV